jgi:gliding motility-associated-like protein
LINTRELLKNKSLDPSVFIIKNLKFPDKARVVVKNNSIYFDRNDLIDAQTVDVEFEICSTVCPTVCNKGKVSFVLEQLVDNTDFSVPKVFALNSSSGSSLNIDGLDFFLDGEVTIMNRWGSTVFGPTIYKNNTPEKSWDGQKNGKPLPTGAYYYYIKYKDKDVLKIKKGIIYLIEE